MSHNIIAVQLLVMTEMHYSLLVINFVELLLDLECISENHVALNKHFLSNQ